MQCGNDDISIDGFPAAGSILQYSFGLLEINHGFFGEIFVDESFGL